MPHSTHYDVIIIGTGPGGGTLAYKLAPSGKRILLLERGGYLPREKENWNSRTVFIENRYKAKETWRDKHGRPFHPGIHYNVGGNSKVYGAALLRMRPQDFGEVKHDGGISPEWPICYEDLEPITPKPNIFITCMENMEKIPRRDRRARSTSMHR
jgi:choline dehydrogenase-like flavoprotein